MKIVRKADAVRLIPQVGANPGQRLGYVAKALFDEDADRVILVSSDIPLLDPVIFIASFRLLREYDVVLGPTFDGSFYLIGTDCFYPELFEGTPWAEGAVYKGLSDRLIRDGLRWQELEISYDFDTSDGLEQLYSDIDHLRLAGKDNICCHMEKYLMGLKH